MHEPLVVANRRYFLQQVGTDLGVKLVQRSTAFQHRRGFIVHRTFMQQAQVDHLDFLKHLCTLAVILDQRFQQGRQFLLELVDDTMQFAFLLGTILLQAPDQQAENLDQ